MDRYKKLKQQEKFSLPKTITGKWIKEKDGSEFLYFEIEGIYFSIKSAKEIDPEAYEKAVASMIV